MGLQMQHIPSITARTSKYGYPATHHLPVCSHSCSCRTHLIFFPATLKSVLVLVSKFHIVSSAHKTDRYIRQAGEYVTRTWSTLSSHVATMNSDTTFQPQRSWSVTKQFCNWSRPLRSKCLTTAHCCYVNAQCQSSSMYVRMHTTARASTTSSACNTLDTIEKRQFVVVTTASSIPTAINTMTLPLTFRLQCWGLHQSIYIQQVSIHVLCWRAWHHGRNMSESCVYCGWNQTDNTVHTNRQHCAQLSWGVLMHTHTSNRASWVIHSIRRSTDAFTHTGTYNRTSKKYKPTMQWKSFRTVEAWHMLQLLLMLNPIWYTQISLHNFYWSATICRYTVGRQWTDTCIHGIGSRQTSKKLVYTQLQNAADLLPSNLHSVTSLATSFQALCLRCIGWQHVSKLCLFTISRSSNVETEGAVPPLMTVAVRGGYHRCTLCM